MLSNRIMDADLIFEQCRYEFPGVICGVNHWRYHGKRANTPDFNVTMEQTYDDAVEVAQELVESRGLTFIHSTNDLGVLAGAATIALEVFDQAPAIDAFVISIGGGSQALGALTVARELSPQNIHIAHFVIDGGIANPATGRVSGAESPDRFEMLASIPELRRHVLNAVVSH